jgi:hypothetical protein
MVEGEGGFAYPSLLLRSEKDKNGRAGRTRHQNTERCSKNKKFHADRPPGPNAEAVNEVRDGGKARYAAGAAKAFSENNYSNILPRHHGEFISDR